MFQSKLLKSNHDCPLHRSKLPQVYNNQKGPWALDHSPESFSQGEDINPISPTPKSILGITQIITKSYQVTKFNQNILICTISMSDLFTHATQKVRGVHKVKHV